MLTDTQTKGPAIATAKASHPESKFESLRFGQSFTTLHST